MLAEEIDAPELLIGKQVPELNWYSETSCTLLQEDALNAKIGCLVYGRGTDCTTRIYSLHGKKIIEIQINGQFCVRQVADLLV